LNFGQIFLSLLAGKIRLGGTGGAGFPEVEDRIAGVHIAAELGFISDGGHDHREKAVCNNLNFPILSHDQVLP